MEFSFLMTAWLQFLLENRKVYHAMSKIYQEVNMKYVGLDIHKEFCVATEMDEEGNIIRDGRIETSREAIEEFFSSVERGKVAIESTGIWDYIYEILDVLGLEVKLVNPVKARAIAAAKIKTDKVDATILAHLLRSNLIPEVYIGNREMRELKRLINERLLMKKIGNQIKNRIRSELLRRGIRPEMNIFTKKGEQYLRALRINSIIRELRVLESVEKEIHSIDEELLEYYENNEDAQLLATIPGVGYYTALTLAAVIGDINRFPSSERLSSYFGLVPSTKQSANTVYRGPITKEGSSTVRWLLIQCAWVHVTHCTDSFLTKFYQRIAKKKGKRKAIVAMARKMTRVIYWMLKTKEPFHVEGYKIRDIHAE